MDLVKVISTDFDSVKKRIVKFLRMGKSDVRTSAEVGPYGIDSNPVKDMIAVYSPTSINGKTVILGYINKNQLAAVGEVRMYSTDAEGGLKFYTWLKNDGTYEIGGNTDNAVRYSKLADAFNQLKSDHNDLVGKFNSALAEMKVFAAAYTPGSPSVLGTPPTFVVTTSSESTSAADIAPAKINEVKTL